MKTVALADQLRTLGVTVIWSDGAPRLKVPAGVLSDELGEAIAAAHKPSLLVALDFEGSLADMQRRMIAKLDAGDHEGGEAIREQMTRLILGRSCVRCPGVGLAPGDRLLCAECRGEVRARVQSEVAAVDGPGRPCGACRSDTWRRGRGAWVCSTCSPDPSLLYAEWVQRKETAA